MFTLLGGLVVGCGREAVGPPDVPDLSSPTVSSPTETTPAAPLTFASGRAPRNLLVLSLDTTRRDRIGRFSGRTDTTPFLDARLAEGVALDDHRSCSNWTAPSVLCATTGASPNDLGFWPGTGDPDVPATPEGLRTIASALRDEGYTTSLVTANRVFSDALDTAQGFDTLEVRDYESADAIAALGREQVAALQAAGAPWYLHLHFMDPHRPYCPPAAYRDGLDALPVIGVDVCEELQIGTERWPEEDDAWRQALLDRVDLVYRGELRFFDDTLRDLWADLDAAGALDDTLVVFFTDHGEQMMERGVIDHGFELHAEENRATAGFWAKDLAPGAWAGPTTHTDLAATVFALHGLPLGPAATGLPLGEAPEDRVRRLFAYSRVDHGGPQLAVVQGPRSLHVGWDGVRSFHRLDEDPAELVDAYDAEDPDVVALTAEIDTFAAEVRETWPHLDAPAR